MIPRRIITTLWSWYSNQLKINPIRTKSLTSGCITGLADLIAQNGRRALDKSGLSDGSPNNNNQPSKDIDLRRSAYMAIYGMGFVGPISHFWHSTLERILKPAIAGSLGSKLRTTVKKVIMDQAIAAPLFTTAFFVSRGCIEGKNLETIAGQIHSDFFKVLRTGIMVWPAAQFVNLFWIPTMYRVLFTNCVGLGWSTFMSFSAGRRSNP